MEQARYIVGIDLGTTNCVVAYIDTHDNTGATEQVAGNDIKDGASVLFTIPQITDMGCVEGLKYLPSFMFIPPDVEDPQKHYKLPWSDNTPYVVGKYAVKRGALSPTLLISSAKSWLCNQAVDRTSPILPYNAPDSVKKHSPLEVSTYFLNHIRQAWNFAMATDNPQYALENQDVYITVPASFDAVARELTVKAANSAGLPNITLLEEPLTAFYAWLNRSKDDWRKHTKVGDIILVCDIGGGTTDFSLIEVAQEDGDLVLKRIAVGDHILLGGDNMDLAMAYAVKKVFAQQGVNLDQYQMLGLVQGVREAKEKMLSDPDVATHPIVVLGRGRSVVGGTIQTTLKQEEVQQTLVDGFFPVCNLSDSPVERSATGFKELGLHYAADTAVTKHMSRFLRQHVQKVDDPAVHKKESTAAKTAATKKPHSKPVYERNFIHPTKILFNGGVTKARSLCLRIVEVLNQWLKAEGAGAVEVLQGNDPDISVALGAAYYGFTRRGKGIRVRAGAGRSYYVGIETAMPAVPGMTPPIKAVCVVPFGMEEGTDIVIEGQEFGLVVGEQSTFRFLSSTTRKTDVVGQILDEWETEQLTELAPFETTLQAEGTEGAVIPVKLHSYLTETGSLQLWCKHSTGTNNWKLEFNVRISDQSA
ncbi:MAG: Hsp70 family protein [Nitrospirae bacterium]|uniref:Hsp70 family protein n=1 Tax=Candidatus Magnetobacterium casense TaxID=1455061 RepID=UPI00058F07EA|nr:Hsp70 family protein [Candidatus Magnetobacterium casensis]MBF0339142.1 Hsp70 family protein [Nitrospirota bacterium]